MVEKISTILSDFVVDSFLGQNTAVKSAKNLERGMSPDALNWVTGYDAEKKKGDHIELRRGSARLGATKNTGSGLITGLGVGTRYDGTQIPFFTYGRKVKYYDSATDDTIEVGSNLLPAGASGENASIEPYQNLAGSFVYISSPTSSIYKIPVANPGSAVDLLATAYRGYINFSLGRMNLWNRNGATAGNNDKTGYYKSYIDKSLLSSYTQTTGEAYGTGDGTTKTFTHTVANIGAKKTCMYISVTDGTETFVDNRNGAMTGTLGGTGTVNYATGAISVTFNAAPANLAAITCSYYIEDATTAGVADFSSSSPRTAGQGNVFRQDDGGGNLQIVQQLGQDNYCFHSLRTWVETDTLTDTSATNLPYRNLIGTPFYKGAFATGDGILFLDNTNPAYPKLSILAIPPNSTNTTIVPINLSEILDLSGNAFDYAVVFRWGNYDILSCQTFTNGVKNTYNSIVYVRNIVSGFWDKLDYMVSQLATYNGTLISGDAISNNIFTLFSGFDDDGAVINNYWLSSQFNLDYVGVKRTNRMTIKGLIAPAQSFDVYVSYDFGQFTKIQTISGSGAYVNKGIPVLVGSQVLGSQVLGGGGGSVTAYPFELDFPLNSDLYEYIQIKFVATAVGYVEIDSFSLKDNRIKGRHLLAMQTL